MPAGETYDGQVRVIWLATDPADPDGPTAAEIAAGTNLSGYVPSDGVAYNIGNDRVSGADMLSSFKSEAPGRRGANPSITFKRMLEGGAEVAWTTVGSRGVTGALVIFEHVAEGTLTPLAGEPCFVFTGCKTGEPVPQNTAENTEKRFVVDFFVGEDMFLDGVVAA